MIIDFTIKNYLSIKDEVLLSFLSNNKNINDDLKVIAVENDRYHLYSFSAIYGANASGKSNIIKALSDLISLINFSHRFDLDQPIPAYRPFRLEKENLNLPTGFEIEFIAGQKRYIYLLDFNKNEILKEELFYFPEGRKANLFKRHKNRKIKYGSYFTGEKKGLETILLPNRLLLSVAANSNNDVLKPVFRFFRDMINIHVKMDSSYHLLSSTTLELREKNDNFKNLLFKILKAADLNAADIKLVEDQKVEDKFSPLFQDIPEDIKKKFIDSLRYKPFLGHPVYEKGQVTGQIEYFDLQNEESTGTIKMYDIAGQVLHSLQHGSILIIDEFNSGLHPLLNNFLVELFIDPTINKKNAQLLISTHDTCVLDLRLLKREQIWFTEKTPDGATQLFSLDEFENDKNLIRDNSKYAKYYLDGRFKAVPALDKSEIINGLF